MYLRSFLLTQVLGLLTAHIWACFRLRRFALAFMIKLNALADAGYIPVPLPHEMADYLQAGSILKAACFFTFTFGFTLGMVAWAGAFCVNRFKCSRSVRLGWTAVVSALFSYLLGFSLIEFLLFLVYFGGVHLCVTVPRARFRPLALACLIPFVLIPSLYGVEHLFLVRNHLLRSTVGRKAVGFYYHYSPLPAEMITPPGTRTQVAAWVSSKMGNPQKQWLLRRGIYLVENREAADAVIHMETRSGPDVLEAVKERAGGNSVRRLRTITYYSIFLAVPITILVLCVFLADRLLMISTRIRIALLVAVGLVSLVLVWGSISWRNPNPARILSSMDLEEEHHESEKTATRPIRERLLDDLLSSPDPARRLRAAEALRQLPSGKNVEPLKKAVTREPIVIVRCKAILALSHQRDRRVVSFLESRLRGSEAWYVKHYLFRALRRLGWIG